MRMMDVRLGVINTKGFYEHNIEVRASGRDGRHFEGLSRDVL